MSTGCKVWLWMVFLGNLVLLPVSAVVPISLICSVINLISIGLLIFARKMAGLYLLLLNAAINCLIFLGAGAGALTILASIVSPIITAVFVFANADVFD